MTVNIQKGDLFLLDKHEYVFTHCISTDLAWGKGIVVPMMRFFHCGNAWRKNNNRTKYKVGDIGIHHIMGDPEKNIRQEVCLHMFTKNKYNTLPTYQGVTKALESVRNYMTEHNLHKLAMPKIGCGLDKLEWKKVYDIICETFKETDIKIEVRYL